jgi:hypothetical protein
MFRTSRFLASLALCVATAPIAAQDIIPVDSVRHAGRYDVATQTFYPVDSDPQAQYESTGTVLFNNSTLSGGFTTGSGAIVTHHFMDWGTANFGGGGATVESFTIGYATNVVAPTPVNMRVRIYQGATGFGVQGTVLADFVLTGLPNHPGGAGFSGFTVDVTPVTPFAIVDGAIGWSYNSDMTGSTTGPLLVGPPNEAGVINAYDRYLESTNAYIGTFQFTPPTVGSFVLKLTGRLNNPPPVAWEQYGNKKVVTLTGDGPGTPLSANEITIKSTAVGKPVLLVVGITQSAVYSPSLNMNFYALPWLVELGTFIPDPMDASVHIPFVMPDIPLVNPGDEIFFQAFGKNLANVWANYSKGLKLTIQP